MVDQLRLAEFWENSVPEQYKHYEGTEFENKAGDYEAKLNEHLISRIDFKDVRVALDWGCGGGYGSSILSVNADVIALDISKTSLSKASQYLSGKGITLKNSYLLGDLESLEISERIDLIFSASVIQHFPSYEYWKKVAAKWLEIEPLRIAIQSRHGDENRDNENQYYNGVKNYILGLYLTTEEVVSTFSSKYDLTYHFLDDDGYSMYEYFVFRNKLKKV